ncbi:arginase family protein [Micromonospora coxensis]|uniref:Arginase n=1 Tax=Micromonospora coxensis TaxID=356852 RepID=A0A1C5I1V9_9ACTN|nr:arginase [Micromonospora coxensis]
MMRRIAVLDAPTNLGLRPPTSTSVPGCAKAPGALRDHGLLARLRARDAGCLTPPRYDPGDWRPGDGVCHAREISGYSVALADRIGAIIDRGEFPLVLGGDCSVLLGSALAMHRLGEAVGGRIGLVFVDGHSDFRHPGNASYVGAAAGEDLALVTGRGQADLAAIEGRRPYFRDIDVVVLGIRAQDEYRLDLQAAGITTRPVPALRAEGAARSAQWAHEQLADCAGYWVHIDVDVLDPAVMPAVDAPDPGGIAFAELEILLAGLVDTPHCLGVELTVFDPDYDPDGSYAAEIVNTVVAGLAPVSAPEAVPPRLLPPPSAVPRVRTARRPDVVAGPDSAADGHPAGPPAGSGSRSAAPGASLSAARGALSDGLGAVADGAVRAADVDPAPGYPVPEAAGSPDARPVPRPAAPPEMVPVVVEPVGPPASAGPGLLRRVPPPEAGDEPTEPPAGIA